MLEQRGGNLSLLSPDSAGAHAVAKFSNVVSRSREDVPITDDAFPHDRFFMICEPGESPAKYLQTVCIVSQAESSFRPKNTISPRPSLSRLVLFNINFRPIIFRMREYCTGEPTHIPRWSAAAIFDDRDKSPYIFLGQDPDPFMSVYGNINDGHKGSLSGCKALSCGIIRAYESIPLEQRSKKSQYPDACDYACPNDQLVSDRSKSSRFAYKRVFVGSFIVVAGWAMLWFAFSLFDKANKSFWRIAAATVVLLMATFVMGHGLFYACLGVFGLPSLYIL